MRKGKTGEKLMSKNREKRKALEMEVRGREVMRTTGCI